MLVVLLCLGDKREGSLADGQIGGGDACDSRGVKVNRVSGGSFPLSPRLSSSFPGYIWKESG